MLLRLAKSTVIGQEFTSLFPRNAELQSYSIEYMRLVVVLSTEAICFMQRSTLRQLSDALLSSYEATFPPLESQMRDVCELIKAKVSLLTAQANQESHSLTHRFLATANALQYDISRELSRVKQMEKEADRYQALLSLSPAQASFERHYRRHRGKGHSTWLFEHEKYKLWQTAPSSSVFWLRGTLGSGKSVVAASAAAHLLLDRNKPMSPSPTHSDPEDLNSKTEQLALTGKREELQSVCYCFADERDPATLSARAVLGSITFQILRDVVSQGRQTAGLSGLIQPGNTAPLPQEYVDILITCMPQDWSAVIILDGLDTCQPKDFQLILVQLLRLADYRAVRIFCSARASDTSFPTSSMGSDVIHRIDIDRVDRSVEVGQYITDRLRHWAEDDLFSAELAEAIVAKLQLGFAGMFLWLSLQMEAIAEDLEAGVPVRDILLHLPPDLEQVYAAAIRRIGDLSEALKIMKIVAAAEPPLTFDELRVAAAITPGTFDVDFSRLPKREAAFVRSFAGHLLEIDEDRKVHFIHHSAMLHMIEPKDRSDEAGSISGDVDFRFKVADAKELFASIVVTYLNHPALNQSLISKKQGTPLSGDLICSAVTDSVKQKTAEKSGKLYHLIKHIPAEKQKHEFRVDINDLLSKIQARPSRPADDFRLFHNYAKSHWVMASPYLDLNKPALFQSLHNIVEGSVEAGALPFNPARWSDALDWTTKHGHHCLYRYYFATCQVSAVSFDTLRLIDAQLEANKPTFSIIGPALLPVLVSLLQSSWSPMNSNLTALIFRPEATFGYQLSYHMIQELAKDAPSVWIILRRCKAMFDQMAEGHVEAFMQEHGVQTPEFQEQHSLECSLWPGSSHDGRGYFSPVLDAARLGDTKCLEFLLRHGANLEIQDESGRTALMLAASHGSDDIIELLLEYGDLINRETSSGETALLCATQGNHAHTIRLLLERGARLMSYLLDHDGMGRSTGRDTELHEAAATGSVNVLAILLEWAGSRALNALDNEGRSPFYRAYHGGNWLCVEILARAGADQDISLRYAPSVARHVVYQAGEDPDVFRLLLPNDARLLFPNNGDRLRALPLMTSVLYSACARWQWDFARRLLKAGVDLDHTMHEGLTVKMLVESNLGRDSELFRLICEKEAIDRAGKGT